MTEFSLWVNCYFKFSLLVLAQVGISAVSILMSSYSWRFIWSHFLPLQLLYRAVTLWDSCIFHFSIHQIAYGGRVAYLVPDIDSLSVWLQCSVNSKSTSTKKHSMCNFYQRILGCSHPCGAQLPNCSNLAKFGALPLCFGGLSDCFASTSFLILRRL